MVTLVFSQGVRQWKEAPLQNKSLGFRTWKKIELGPQRLPDSLPSLLINMIKKPSKVGQAASWVVPASK